MDLLIVHDGKRAQTAAEAMARTAIDSGVDAKVVFIGAAEHDDVTQAGALVVGCWVKGDIPFGGDAIDDMVRWIEALPPLDGKVAGAYCTYGLYPLTFADSVARTGEVLQRMKAGLESKGARVTSTHAIRRRVVDESASLMIHEILENIAA